MLQYKGAPHSLIVLAFVTCQRQNLETTHLLFQRAPLISSNLRQQLLVLIHL